ncbi:MAG TPA: D-alanyl-D-alanine carboxypeptidase family protein [Pyrinomonadaceae bacterium]
MPENKRNVVVVLVALAALCVAMTMVAAAWSGQNPSPAKTAQTSANEAPESSTKLTAATRPREAATTRAGSAFSSAATENALLRHNLNWAFGGKQQRGWSLYLPLINQLIGTESEAGTTEFASALARWQTGAGLSSADGVLDDETLYKMVSVWQSRRLKDRAYPRADQLLTAPASDFWDATRAPELRQVEIDAYMAYKRMVAEAAKDPSLGLLVTSTGEIDASEKFLKIVSSFRSREYQQQLRQQSPHSGRAGLAVNSPHFTGCALDLYVGGEPVETKDANRAIQVQTPVYKWLVRNAQRFGFYPYYYEPWHWEYRGH